MRQRLVTQTITLILVQAFRGPPDSMIAHVGSFHHEVSSKLALQADPNHSQALYNLARALEKQHDPEAQQYQQRFDDLQKQQQTTDRVQQLGNFALEAAGAQNWPQAVEQMQEAIQLCGACADAAHLHHNLGLFYCKTGKFKEAEAELQKAIDLDPDDADARKAIAIVENLRSSESK